MSQICIGTSKHIFTIDAEPTRHIECCLGTLFLCLAGIENNLDLKEVPQAFNLVKVYPGLTYLVEPPCIPYLTRDAEGGRQSLKQALGFARLKDQIAGGLCISLVGALIVDQSAGAIVIVCAASDARRCIGRTCRTEPERRIPLHQDHAIAPACFLNPSVAP